MNKQAPSPPRILAMVAFALSCFGLLLFLWIAFGGPVPLAPKGYRFSTSFGEATQLAVEADVRISGVPVGKVKSVETDDSGRSSTVIELESRYAPLPSDARAILRQKTLLGETYVELTPGSAGAPKLREGGRLPSARVSDTVELDEIFRAFDARTRRAFQGWLQNQALAIDGRGRDVSDALGNLQSFATDAHSLVRVLNRQQGGVRQLVANTGEVFGALTERGDQLRELIDSSNQVFATTAQRDEQLRDTFRILPTFNREATDTVRRLARFAAAADPLVDQLRPAARELSPTLTDLSALAPDLRALFRDLDPLVDASKRGLPAAERILSDLRPVLDQADPFLRQVIPITDFLGLYRRELSAFFANTVAATQATDQPPGAKGRVHYLRTSNPLNLENLAVYSKRLGTNRSNPYQKPGAFADLSRGLPVYEDRSCGRGLPLISSAAATLLGDKLVNQIDDLLEPVTSLIQGKPGSERPSLIAPPCRKQGPFDLDGRQTQYPQVRAR